MTVVIQQLAFSYAPISWIECNNIHLEPVSLYLLQIFASCNFIIYSHIISSTLSNSETRWSNVLTQLKKPGLLSKKHISTYILQRTASSWGNTLPRHKRNDNFLRILNRYLHSFLYGILDEILIHNTAYRAEINGSMVIELLNFYRAAA